MHQLFPFEPPRTYSCSAFLEQEHYQPSRRNYSIMVEKTLKKLIVPLLISFLAIGIISTAFVYASADDLQTSNVIQVERRLNINDTPQGVIIRSDVEQGNVENHFALLF